MHQVDICPRTSSRSTTCVTAQQPAFNVVNHQWRCWGVVIYLRKITPPKFNIAPEKWWFERLLSFWDGKNSGSMLNFQGVPYNCPHSTQKIISCYKWNNLRRLSQLRSETKSPWHQVQSLWRSKPPQIPFALPISSFSSSLCPVGVPVFQDPCKKCWKTRLFSVKKTPLQCQAKICRNDSPTAGYGPGYKGEGDKIWDVKIAEAKRETKRAIHYLV